MCFTVLSDFPRVSRAASLLVVAALAVFCSAEKKSSAARADTLTLSSSPASGRYVSSLTSVTLDFSREVRGGEDVSDYELSGSGRGTLAIVTVARDSARRYILTLSGTPSDGVVIINFPGVTDPEGNQPLNGPLVFLTSVTQPVVTASPRDASSVTEAAIRTITLGFSQAMDTATLSTLANYSLSGAAAGSLSVSAVTVLSPTKARLTISGAISEGGLLLTLNGITGQGGLSVANPVIAWNVDLTQPVIDIAMSSPSPGVRIRNLTSLTLRFSEAVTGADNPENYSFTYGMAGDPDEPVPRIDRCFINPVEPGCPVSHTISGITPVTDSEYIITINESVPADHINNLRVRLRGVSDLAGNVLGTNADGVQFSYVQDTDNPLVEGIVIAPDPTPPVRVLSSIQVTFTEPVLNAGVAANYTFQNAPSLSVSSVTGTGRGPYTLTLAGTLPVDFTGNVILQMNSDNIIDIITNKLFPEGPPGFPEQGAPQNIAVDTLRPTATVTPVAGSRLNSLSTIVVTYSEAMDANSLVAANYVLSGPGITCTVCAGNTIIAVAQAGNTYTLTVNPDYTVTDDNDADLNDDTLTLTINNSFDIAANTLNGTTTTWNGDIRPPTVTAVQFQNENNVAGTIFVGEQTGIPTNPLTWMRVTFSEPVTTATATALANYFFPVANGKTRTSVAWVAGNQYQVNLGGTITNVAFSVRVRNVADLAGNVMAVANFTDYQGDNTRPTIVTDGRPADTSRVRIWPTPIDITFSEPVINGTTAGNYTRAGTGVGTLNIGAVTDLSGNTFRVPTTGAVGNGPFTFAVQAIRDRANNQMITSTRNYTADTTPPTVNTSTPADGANINALTTIAITTTENVTNGNQVARYTLSGGGCTTNPTSVTGGVPGTNFTLTVSCAPVTGDTITLSTNGLIDTATIPSGNTQVIANVRTFNFDNTRPVVTTDGRPADGALINALNTGMQITFSETITGGTTAANYALSGTGCGTRSVSSVTGTGAGPYTLTFAGTLGNGACTFTVNNMTDAFGNTMLPNARNYTVDTVRPSATASNPASGTTIGTTVPAIGITLSESVTNGTNTALYVFSGGCTGTASSVTGGGTSYTVNPPVCTPVHSSTVTLTLNGLTDAAGNVQVTAQNVSFPVDGQAPTITSDNRSADGGTFRGIPQPAATTHSITFSEPVTNATNIANYLLTGPGCGTRSITSVTGSGAGPYTINYGGAVPVAQAGSACSHTIQNITDAVGNILVTSTRNYTIDTLAPSVASTTPANGATVNATFPFFLVNTSELVTNATALARYSISGGGCGLVSVTTIAGDEYQVNISCAPPTGASVTFTIDGLQDGAGNTQATIVSRTITFSP